MDPLDYIILGSCTLGFATFFYGLLRLIWRKPRGPGERLAQRGASRIILRSLTKTRRMDQWN